MNASWLTLFERKTWYNIKASQEFTRKFTGTVVNFASTSFEVSETSIVEATGLYVDGKKLFKNLSFEVDMKNLSESYYCLYINVDTTKQ